MFESSISSSNDGNFSYIIIGARERIWYKNNECFFKNEIGTIEKVDKKEYSKRKITFMKLSMAQK